MDKISCSVCLDLIPLVKDNVASEDSILLVEEHIKTCQKCKQIFSNGINMEEYSINDQKVIKDIKKNLYLFSLAILLVGSIIGIILSNSMGMFYNFIIMPVLGGIGYFTLNRKWYVVPLSILVLSYIWVFIANAFEGMLAEGMTILVILAPLYLSGIYAALALIGVIIAALIKFAFRKEE